MKSQRSFATRFCVFKLVKAAFYQITRYTLSTWIQTIQNFSTMLLKRQPKENLLSNNLAKRITLSAKVTIFPKSKVCSNFIDQERSSPNRFKFRKLHLYGRIRVCQIVCILFYFYIIFVANKTFQANVVGFLSLLINFYLANANLSMTQPNLIHISKILFY